MSLEVSGGNPIIASEVLDATADRLETASSDIQACVLGAVESSLLLPSEDIVQLAGELDAEAEQDLDLTTSPYVDIPEPLLPIRQHHLMVEGGDSGLADWRLREALAARLVAKNIADDIRRREGVFSRTEYRHDDQIPAAQLMARQIIRNVYNGIRSW